MKKLFVCLLISVGSMALVHGQQSLSDLKPEQYYDFWVGEWDLKWTDAQGKPGHGTNTIRKILDGVVIEENFRATEGGFSGYKGKSVSVYNPQRKSWHQAWVDNQGGYIDLLGRIDGEKRIFQTGEREGPDGKPIISRMVFYDIRPESFTWDWESSSDDGDTWDLNWRIHYTRK